MSLTTVKKLQQDVQNLKVDMKKVKDILELSPVIDPLNWKKDLSDLDLQILLNLLAAGYAGMQTPDLARVCNLQDPGKSGRVTIWHRLKKIQKISYRLKGDCIVLLERRRWRMNWENFTFAGYPKQPAADEGVSD